MPPPSRPAIPLTGQRNVPLHFQSRSCSTIVRSQIPAPRSQRRPQPDQELSVCLSDLLLFLSRPLLRWNRSFRFCVQQMWPAKLPRPQSRSSLPLARSCVPHSQIRQQNSSSPPASLKFPSKPHLRLAPAPPLPRSPRFPPALHPSASYPWGVLREPPPPHPRCSPPPYPRLPYAMKRLPFAPVRAGQRCANPDSRRYKSPARPHLPLLPSFSSWTETRSGSSTPNLPREAHSGRGS